MTGVQNYVASETLKDGTPVKIRAIRPTDGSSILDVFEAVDRESIYTRFFAYKKELTDAELRQITEVDFDQVVALVVTTPAEDGEELIGGGRYFAGVAPNSSHSAEVAFMTDDHYRGRGVASLVLKQLVRIGRAQGLMRFEADVLAQNQAMLAVFRRSGLLMKQQSEGNIVHVTLSLDADPGPTPSWGSGSERTGPK